MIDKLSFFSDFQFNHFCVECLKNITCNIFTNLVLKSCSLEHFSRDNFFLNLNPNLFCKYNLFSQDCESDF